MAANVAEMKLILGKYVVVKWNEMP